MLLHNRRLQCDADMKMSFSIQSFSCGSDRSICNELEACTIDLVFARLEELQLLQHTIRLNELPLVQKKPELCIKIFVGSPRYKHLLTISVEGTKRIEGQSCVRQKKLRIAFEELDLEKDQSELKKHELELYLSNHQLKKTGKTSQSLSALLKNTCMRLISNLFM